MRHGRTADCEQVIRDGYAAAVLHVLDLRQATADLRSLLPRPDLAGEGPVAEVRAIVADVRAHGDTAVREYTRRFDGVDLDDLSVPLELTQEALGRIAPDLREALTVARDNIEAFYQRRPQPHDRYERRGIRIDSLEIPVDRAGVYVPGGRAKYPLSVLMTAIPPKVAGVGAVALCVPPGPDGNLPDELLAAAALAGVDEVYRVGGPQAIAAMAYGTKTVPKVDVIVGAGSRWVSLAKQEVRGVVGVPAAFAGPSEVVVIADGTVPPACAAIDVVVQAEHGPDGLSWLVTWSETALKEINGMIGEFVASAPRRAEIESTLAAGGYAVLVDGPAQAMAVANEIAPEHLELLLRQSRRAGASRPSRGRRLPRCLVARVPRGLSGGSEPRAADLPFGAVRERARRRGFRPPRPRDRGEPRGAPRRRPAHLRHRLGRGPVRARPVRAGPSGDRRCRRLTAGLHPRPAGTWR